jgi:putative oxidoreductase
MEDFYDSWQPRFRSILRIVTALLLIPHGTMKLLGWPSGSPMELFSLMGAAGTIEVVGGILFLIGWFTRPTAFILAGFTAAAYFMAHAAQAFLPIQNGGELAALYCFVFLYFSMAGAGEWSVDAMLSPGRRHTNA